MPTLQNWLIGKGLALAESSVKTLLEIKDSQEVLSTQLEGALQKLDRLLGAPYQVALLHAREGEVTKAIDHLKEAIALRPLHLPARVLHIRLLCLEKKYEAALENYWDLLRGFSYRADLVPPLLYQAFLESVGCTPVRSSAASPLQIERPFDDDWPVAAWCSPTAVAVEWLSHSKWLFFDWDSRAVTLHTWTGKQLHESKTSPELGLVMLTSEYAVYKGKDDQYRVVSLGNGAEVEESPIDAETFRAIFLPASQALEASPLYQLTHFTRDELLSGAAGFADVALRLGSREVEEEEAVPAAFVGDGSIVEPFRTVTVRKPYLECLDRPLPTAASGAAAHEIELALA